MMKALLRSETALELKDRGDYAGAREAMGVLVEARWRTSQYARSLPFGSR